jgi:hypothetical protein
MAASVDLELTPTALGHPISLSFLDFGARWMAIVESGSTRTHGLGASAREALQAALAPFGRRATAVLMADPAMFGASAELLALRATS